jgi:hypothetical protein
VVIAAHASWRRCFLDCFLDCLLGNWACHKTFIPGCHSSCLMQASASMLLVLGGLALSGVTQATGPSSSFIAETDATLMAFDIPAQPLGQALRKYASISHLPAIAPSELLAGRTSSAVHGKYAAPEALQQLLVGTGLRVEPVPGGAAGGFILEPGEGTAMVPPLHASDIAPDLDGYPALVQSRIWQALCARPQTAPGTYRLILRFEIDAIGQLQRVRVLGSGDAVREAAVLAALQALRLDFPPPPAFPQPMTLLIETHAAAGGPSCDPRAS